MTEPPFPCHTHITWSFENFNGYTSNFTAKWTGSIVNLSIYSTCRSISILILSFWTYVKNLMPLGMIEPPFPCHTHITWSFEYFNGYTSNYITKWTGSIVNLSFYSSCRPIGIFILSFWKYVKSLMSLGMTGPPSPCHMWRILCCPRWQSPRPLVIFCRSG